MLLHWRYVKDSYLQLALDLGSPDQIHTSSSLHLLDLFKWQALSRKESCNITVSDQFLGCLSTVLADLVPNGKSSFFSLIQIMSSNIKNNLFLNLC